MSIFKTNELLQESSNRTGLTLFGPEDFREGLDVLVTGLNTDVRLNPDRVDALRERILRLLMNRQWFARDLEQHPEILEEDLGSPIVITSLPRTASTKLHRLLGASGAFQTPMMWETHMFARIPGLPNGGRERRIAETREYEHWIYQASPELITGHPVFTDEPEEDMMLSEFSFRHSFLQGILNSPTYLEWIATADMQPMYDYLAMQLKYLQWQHGGSGDKPWLLKTPIHFGAEMHLVDLFGSARFIVTHRDPVKCIPSIASTTQGWRALYTQAPQGEEIGKEHLEMFSFLADKHIAWRKENTELDILDISFQEVTGDGIGTAKKIFTFFDLPLTAQAEQAMTAWEKENTQGKHGKHSYTAQQMGVSEQEIRDVFAEYINRFSQFI